MRTSLNQWQAHDEVRQALLLAMETLDRMADNVTMLHDRHAPLSFDHGDFWPGQVIVREDLPVFLDWSDARICQPWLGIMHFLYIAVGIKLVRSRSRCRAILAEYMRQWPAHHSANAQQQALRTAWQLSPLATALFHTSGLVGRLDPHCQCELYPAMTHYLQEFHKRCQADQTMPWE